MLNIPLTHFWAKLGKHSWPEHYHPLICHMIDVGVVGQLLWDRSSTHSRKLFCEHLGLSEKDARAWLGFWIAAHDIGKASPSFQLCAGDRSVALKKDLGVAGFSVVVIGKAPAHQFISVPLLQRWLEQKFSRKVAMRIAYAVGGHHGFFGISPEASDILGAGGWMESQNALLNKLAEVFELSSDAVPTGGDKQDQSYLMYFAGLTTAADWIGSNEYWFPWRHDLKPDGVANYFIEAKRKAEYALNQIRWPLLTPVVEPLKDFKQTFHYRLQGKATRPLQDEIEKLVNAATGPALFLVEAPMGEGKTEAALYVSEWWRRKTGAGTYVALPTMATSNGMFTRMRAFLEETFRKGFDSSKSDANETQLHLLHGHSILNEDYIKLKEAQNPNGDDIENADEQSVDNVISATDWFATQKKQAILAPYGVGTIDQALLSVLQTKHFFLRLYGLAGKTIILDEVHAYDTYMSTLMERLLEWLAKLGCPVVLLSATLPSDKRKALIKAYSGKDDIDKSEGYPRITVADNQGNVTWKKVEADSSRQKLVKIERISDAGIANYLKSKLSEGGCACVIRNTVGSAQQTYLQLKQEFGDELKVILFHARFLFGRRAEIEKEVLDLFGPDGKDRNKIVLVATQVVEQSLDLDFDVMITDVAPIDLILQRAGRLHRHGWRTRPRPLTDATLCIIDPVIEGEEITFRPSELIYSKYPLLRTWEVIEKLASVTLPDDIQPMVEAVYCERDESNEEWVTAKEKVLEDSRLSEQNAENSEIFRPVISRNFWMRLEGATLAETDDPTCDPTRLAATREQKQPSIQLIFGYTKAGSKEDTTEVYLDPECTHKLKITSKPTLKEIKEILKNSASVIGWKPWLEYKDKPVPKGWEESKLLRYYRLVRLDPSGCSIGGQVKFEVNENIGVTLQ